MADIFLRSTDGSDGDNGSTWALAKATAAAAITAAGSGGKIYASDNHSEVAGAAITLACSTDPAQPNVIMSVDDNGNPEPPTALLTGATISTGVGNFILSVTGFGVFRQIKFVRPGISGAALLIGGAATPVWQRFEDCIFELSTTGTAARVTMGVSSANIDDSQVEWQDVQVTFGATAQGINAIVPLTWIGGSAAATGTVPTTLFLPTAGLGADVTIRGVDLSAFNSGNSLVNVSTGTIGHYKFINCKLGASVTATTGTHPGQGGVTVELLNCDSGDTNYRNEWWGYQGNYVTETTIVRTGGATDGATPISYELTSSAAASQYSPLVWRAGYVWNDTIGSAITLTVHVITDNVTLTDKEAWLEVEYLGTSGSTQQSLITDHAADDAFYLGSGANQATSSEAWTTTGLTTPVKQELSVTFTPEEKGPIRFRVMLGKASTVMYLCPEAVVSSQASAAQYQIAEGVYLLAPPAGGGGGFFVSQPGRII